MKTTLLIFIGTFLSFLVIAQQQDKKSVVIGKLTSKDNALLIINPPNSDQGVLFPQLTTYQRLAINPVSPSENGLTVFDKDLKSYYFWSDGVWVNMLADNKIKTNFFNIDPGSFQLLKPSNKVDADNMLLFESDNTFVTISRNSNGREVIAPVNIPHGSILKEVTVYYLDDHVKNLQANLLRKSFSGNNQTMVRWASSGNTSAIRNQTINSFDQGEVIDLENFTYRIVFTFDLEDLEIISEPSQAKQRIYGVKIKYQK